MSATSKTVRRSLAPVFVLGSPRSGTTLLYDMLLSAGGFAVYLAESNVFNLLAPNFGPLEKRENRQQLVNVWLGSKLFRASGLAAPEVEKQIQQQCRNAGDFLRIVMDGIARGQGVERWAENSPEGILYLPLIKRLIPEALVVHIIRDGRDVAMSLNHTRYLRPLPWQDRISLMGAGIYWEWVVQQGRSYGREFGEDYTEVHFEDLIAAPRESLRRVGDFIVHDLNYDRILKVAYGSVRKPNTSFQSEAVENFNPVGRWRRGFTSQQLQRFESMVGKTLNDLGYDLSTRSGGLDMGMRATRWLYRTYFASKLRLKRQPLARKLRPLTSARIDAMVLAEDHPPELAMSVSSQSPQRGRL